MIRGTWNWSACSEIPEAIFFIVVNSCIVVVRGVRYSLFYRGTWSTIVILTWRGKGIGYSYA